MNPASTTHAGEENRNSWRAILELCRCSNLPTVWSNALTGAAIGGARLDDRSFDWTAVGLTAAIASAIYASGMVLNDILDADIDRVERPERPIPSGRMTRRSAMALLALLLVIAFGTAVVAGPRMTFATGILIALVIAYNVLSKRTAFSVVFMAACRMWMYVLGAAAAHLGEPGGPAITASPLLVLFGGVLALHTALLTLISRFENAGASSEAAALTWAWPPIALGFMLVEPPARQISMSVLAASLFVLLLWGAAPRGAAPNPAATRRLVVTWIASMSLLDALFLAVLDQPVASAAAGGCFLLTLILQRKILGT